MNKIICDVCGTAYPETATQCPICGSARADGDQTSVGVTAAEDTSYTYVPGGRFSKRNVRRRSQRATRPESRTSSSRKVDGEDDNTNKALIIVVIALLLAIVAVVIYIGVRYFAPAQSNGDDVTPSQTQSTEAPTDDPTEKPTEEKIPCTSLTVAHPVLEFHEPDVTWLLTVTFEPENTTDKLIFTSSDENVATVSETGRITPVSSGEAIITVTCGEMTAQCRVVCILTDPDATDGTDNNTGTGTGTETGNGTGTGTGTTTADFDFSFRWATYDADSGKYDVTLNVGTNWTAYKTTLTIDPSEITWTIDNTAVATVDNGVVTPVASGKTELHATYGGTTYTCILRVTGGTPAADNTGDNTDQTEEAFHFRWAEYDHASGKYDCTLTVGDTWTAYPTGVDPTAVTWTIDDTSICVISEGKVTALKAGKTELHANYNGETYTCIVRVTG